MAALKLLAGLVVLTLGAELLIRSAVKLALAARVSPLVIGLTVVAFGTSAPELTVSLQSAWRGQADIAVGNVVGSNIFNVLFILGLSAVIIPLVVHQKVIRFDVPLMIAVSLLLYGLSVDGVVGRIDGMLLFGLLVAYTVFSIVKSRREEASIQAEYAQEFGNGRTPVTAITALGWTALAALALGLLIAGSRWFCDGAVEIARTFGVSDLVIGLTLVAVGTSLPEVFTSVLAAIKGERDIAVGNVVGSNLFNILCVIGSSAAIAPNGVPVSPTALQLDLPVMIAAAVVCLPVFFTGHLIARWEGALLLGYYVAYTAYLILEAASSDWSRTVASILLVFVVPLTVITLLIGLVRALRDPARQEGP
ncbi:MAG: calcium/sodium antiporter [Planctomycetaceae bacterium]